MMIENLFLHPSILIASGFESLSSCDVRFLHACQKHFHKGKKPKDNLNQLQMCTPIDFELGGLLNPNDELIEPKAAFHQTAERLPEFPYLTRRQIIDFFYLPSHDRIFQNLLKEIMVCIKKTLGYNDFTIVRLFEAPGTSSKALKMIQKTELFKKVNALHRCGVGDRLSDTFIWVFNQYKLHHLD